MNAIQAKSSKARVTIARNLIVNNITGQFHRNFDSCFEMGDGREVVRLLIERVRTDLELRAMVTQNFRYMPSALYEAAKALPRPTADELFQVQLERANRRFNKVLS